MQLSLHERGSSRFDGADRWRKRVDLVTDLRPLYDFVGISARGAVLPVLHPASRRLPRSRTVQQVGGGPALQPRQHDFPSGRGSDGQLLEGTHEGPVEVLLSMHWKPRLRWTTGAPYVQDASGE
jgi:hypothetical protein